MTVLMEFVARLEERSRDGLGGVRKSIRVSLDRGGIDLVGFDPVQIKHGISAFDVDVRREERVLFVRQELAKRNISGNTFLKPGTESRESRSSQLGRFPTIRRSLIVL